MPEMVLVPRDAAQLLLDDLNARIDSAHLADVPVFPGIADLRDAVGCGATLDTDKIEHAAAIVLAHCAHVRRFTYERTGEGMDAAPHFLAGAAHGLVAMALAGVKPSILSDALSLPAPFVREQGLTVAMLGDRLMISIGLDALMTAAKGGPLWEMVGDDAGWTITDPGGFAEEIVRELEHEEEDGTTPVHVMLDDAIGRAIDQGSLCVDFGHE